jgi:hypothetical protein
MMGAESWLNQHHEERCEKNIGPYITLQAQNDNIN